VYDHGLGAQEWHAQQGSNQAEPESIRLRFKDKISRPANFNLQFYTFSLFSKRIMAAPALPKYSETLATSQFRYAPEDRWKSKF
jgi:hypothetical protein